jgi:hypothetical protein
MRTSAPAWTSTAQTVMAPAAMLVRVRIRLRGDVGVIRDQVRGGTKLATWKTFLREAAEMNLSTKADQDDAGMWLEFPRNKRDAYRQMIPAKGGGWTLWYRFHS